MSMDNETSSVIAQKKLKLLIGGLGVGLPTVLFLGNRWIYGVDDILGSISSYYHSAMRDVFVGVLFTIGMFMITYEGYSLFDRLLSGIGGLLAIAVALFPTTVSGATREMTGTIHLVAAGLFYLSLSIFVVFQFTKSDPKTPKTIRKNIRNMLYYILGLILFLSIALLFLTEMDIVAAPIDNSTFWLEYVANSAFGTALILQ